MPEKYRRYHMKAKEAEALLSQASEKLKTSMEQLLKNKVDVEVVQANFAEVYLFNGRPLLVKAGEKVFPTLAFTEFLASAPKAVVDMGAIPHVCNGANVMAPGIRRYEGKFGKGDFLVVTDEKHGKPLAIGEAMYDKAEAEKVKHGAAIVNVHFVGDRVWSFIKTFESKP